VGTLLQIESSALRLPAAVPTLRANFSWTFAGNVLYSACQWGMISTLAKLGSAAIVGRFALGLAITAPIFMFTNLQLRAVQATDAQSEFAFADYFTLRLLASLAGLSAIALLVLVGRYDRETAIVILLVGLSKTFESLSDVVAGLLQKAERLDRAAVSLIIRGCASLLAFAIVFRISRSLTTALAALAAVWLAVFLLYDLRQVVMLLHVRRRFFAFHWPRLALLARVSAPLGVVMTLLSLNANIPRYLLVHALGQADLGIFASLAYLLVSVNLVVNALGQSVSSRLARMFAEGDARRFRKVLAKLLAFAAFFLALGVPAAKLAGGTVLTFIYRPEYGRHVSLFVIMVATAGVSSIASFLGYAITAARVFQMQVPVVLASTLVTVLCSTVLIPRMGSRGAAFALLLGACVQAIGCALLLHRALQRIPGRG
jgi:O-antigen/teichoic acid export membrane protein